MTSNNQRSGSAFDVTRLSLLCLVVMMSSAPVKSAGGARYASQDPFIQSTLSHTILTPICRVRSFCFERNYVMVIVHFPVSLNLIMKARLTAKFSFICKQN